MGRKYNRTIRKVYNYIVDFFYEKKSEINVFKKKLKRVLTSVFVFNIMLITKEENISEIK